MKHLLNSIIEQQAVREESQRTTDDRQRRNEEGIAALLTIAEKHLQERNKMDERMDVRFAEVAKRFQDLGEKTSRTDERINALVNVVERYISKN